MNTGHDTFGDSDRLNANSVYSKKTKYKEIERRTDMRRSLANKKILICGLALLGLVIIILLIAKSVRPSINLNDYLTIETTGYEGYGTATARIDWDAVEEKYGSKISITGAAQQKYGGFMMMMTPMDVIRDNVSVKLDKNSNLSNDDVITYEWDISEKLSKYVKNKIKYTNDSFVVSNLSSIGTFDAFSDVIVSYSGIAPDGVANISYNGSDLSANDFSIDKNKGLSNGDVIKVFINSNNIDQYANNLGKIPAEFEKSYTVNGLDSYITKVSEIDSDTLKEMQLKAAEVFHDKEVSRMGEWEELISFTYLGCYLHKAVKPIFMGANNEIYLVFRVRMHNTFSNNGDTYDRENDFYWFIKYRDLIMNGNGPISVDLSSYIIPSSQYTIDSGIKSGWSMFYWYYNGYETIEDLENAIRPSDSYSSEEDFSNEYDINVVGQHSEKKHEKSDSESNEQQDDPSDSNDSDNSDSVIKTGGTITVTHNVNIRDGASEEANKIGIGYVGESFDLIEQTNGWCKILYKNQEAYVKADYVE